jgi:acylphosphatase
MVNPNTDMQIRLHMRVTGRVQGVGFRYFVRALAQRSKLNGWVRNLEYDQVEIVAEGPREALDKLAEQVKIGPTGGRVDKVEMDWETAIGEYAGFTVRSSR